MRRKNARRIAISYLSFKKEYIKKIFEGLKTTTIRLGILTPKKDEVLIYGNGKALGKIAIESIRYTKVKDLTDEDAVLDGFKDKRELKAALSKHYPGISADDWVTVIKFRVLERFEDASSTKLDVGRIAKLALAYNIADNREDARILAAVAATGSIDGAYKLLNKRYPRSYIRRLLEKVKKKLEDKAVL